MDVNKVKNVRRAAEGTLTRAITAAKELIDAQRSVNEVEQAFEEAKNAHEALAKKHEEFTMLLNGTEFEDAEIWMQACTSEYTTFSMIFYDFINANTDESEKGDDESSQENDDENDENDENNC